MAKKVLPRHAPTQERGQQRVDRILDATEQEFARVGYESATTNAIARRAKTSVGSLYQYFPNKEAVLYALTDRYLSRLRALHADVVSPKAARLPLPEFFDRLVEALADFQISHPGFRSIFYGSTTSSHLATAARQLHEECIGAAAASIASRHPEFDPERVRLYARINVEVVKALLPLAEGVDKATRAHVLAEIKALLVRYMSGIES